MSDSGGPRSEAVRLRALHHPWSSSCLDEILTLRPVTVSHPVSLPVSARVEGRNPCRPCRHPGPCPSPPMPRGTCSCVCSTSGNSSNRCPAAVAHARAWSLPGDSTAAIDSLDDVLRVAGYGPTATGHRHDDVLRELVRLAAADHLAARVVLQRLLPGISALARRRSGPGRPHREVLDEVVASAWTVIRTYPVDRRHTWSRWVCCARSTTRPSGAHPSPHHVRATACAHLRHPAGRRPPLAADELRELLETPGRQAWPAADIDLARRLARGDSTAEVGAGESRSPTARCATGAT